MNNIRNAKFLVLLDQESWKAEYIMLETVQEITVKQEYLPHKLMVTTVARQLRQSEKQFGENVTGWLYGCCSKKRHIL